MSVLDLARAKVAELDNRVSHGTFPSCVPRGSGRRIGADGANGIDGPLGPDGTFGATGPEARREAPPRPVTNAEGAAIIVGGNSCERDEIDPAEATAGSWPALADARRTRIETELARLPPRCTRDGRRLLDVTRDFLASRWFNRAIALGWDTTELFGINVDAARPLIGDWGFLVTVALIAPPGAKIVSVSEVDACYRTRSGKLVAWPRFRPAVADNVLWWKCRAIISRDN